MAHVSLKIELFNPDFSDRKLKKTFNFYAVGGEERHTDNIHDLNGYSVAKIRKYHQDGQTELIFEKSEILACGVRYSETSVAIMRDGRRDKSIDYFLSDPIIEIAKRRQHFAMPARPDLGIYKDTLSDQRQFMEFQLDCVEENKEERGELLKKIMRDLGFAERTFIAQPYHLLLSPS